MSNIIHPQLVKTDDIINIELLLITTHLGDDLSLGQHQTN